MDIVGRSSGNGDVFVIRNMTDQGEIAEIISDLRREVVSGRTRWFAVVGAGVSYPDVQAAANIANVNLDRS